MKVTYLMPIAQFQTGSTTHLVTLAVITGFTLVLALAIPRSDSGRGRSKLRRLVGWGSLVAGVLNTVYWMSPPHFDPSQSLPLHFCNLANFIGALAILGRSRLFQGVLYFWSGLCLWAFATPTVDAGPREAGFWIFWIYHGFIPLTVVYVLRADCFQPSFRDLLRSAGFTTALVALLSILNAATGWNYGFLGDDVPGVPTPVALLGDYPMRILWMVMCGAAVFVLLWIPYCRYSTTRTRK